MPNKTSLLLFCIVSFSLGHLRAQSPPKIIFKDILQAQVSEGGKNLLNPFCGGINSVQPIHADLNNDGKKDLSLFDHNTETLKTFINVGGAGDEKYLYDPKYATNFPKITSYLKLIDYNCDNIPDLFHRGSGGFNVSAGSYNANNELVFNFYKELRYPAVPSSINAYVHPEDIPIIEDLDGDGDLDFASFDVGDNFIFYFKNLQVENNLPCDSIQVILETKCFGDMYQTYFFRTHVLNNLCKGIGGQLKKYRHPQNCLLSIDINGNGLKDLILGNVSYSDAQVFYNGGTTNKTIFTSQDSLLDFDGHQLEVSYWPAPFYFDIDNDNDKDLIFTPHLDDSNTANYNVMSVYENTGTTANPNFKWRNDSAFVNEMIYVGRNSHPTLFDYDKDGKQDLFIAGEGYFNTITKTNDCQIAYYRNTSTPGNLAFELITKDFLGISAKKYEGIHPAFGDITGDGVDDLIMGNNNGSISAFKNLAPSNSVIPNFVWLTDSIPGIDVGDDSYPIIYDFNSDGKTDLLVGCKFGTLWLYEDTSTTTVKQLKRIDSAIGDVKIGSIYNWHSYGIPFIGPVDSSGKNYLLVGTTDGDIERYDNFTNTHTNWVKKDSTMGNIKSTWSVAPACADLDGDQRPELIVGNQFGGLRLYQFVRNTTVATNDFINTNEAIQLYPNPANNELWIKTTTDISSLHAYRITDIYGRVLLKNHKKQKLNQSINIDALRIGLYFIEILFDNQKIAKGKFIKAN